MTAKSLVKPNCVLHSRLVDVLTSSSDWLLAVTVVTAEGSLDATFSVKVEVLEVSVWFICRLLELLVGLCPVYTGGAEVAPGCVWFDCDVAFFLAVTSAVARLSVTSAAVVVVWVTSVVKKSSAGVDIVKWVATAVTSDADVDFGGTEPGSETVTEHYCTHYKQDR